MKLSIKFLSIIMIVFFLFGCEKSEIEINSNLVTDVQQSKEYDAYLDEVFFKLVDLTLEIKISDNRTNRQILNQIESKIDIKSFEENALSITKQLITKFPQMKEMTVEELAMIFEDGINKRIKPLLVKNACHERCFGEYQHSFRKAAGSVFFGTIGALGSALTGNIFAGIASGWTFVQGVMDISAANGQRENCYQNCP